MTLKITVELPMDGDELLAMLKAADDWHLRGGRSKLPSSGIKSADITVTTEPNILDHPDAPRALSWALHAAVTSVKPGFTDYHGLGHETVS